MIRRTLLNGRLVVTLNMPEPMRGAVAQVLDGEYDAGYSGDGLTILDIGANVGSFAVWANMRWPGSPIHAYEPHPGTFDILEGNVRALRNVVCHRQAVFPGAAAEAPFHARYAGDGEA